MRHNQNRRSRSRNNRKGPNPLTRSYESNGPDVKVRGTAAHVAEKYMTLARDAQSSGDIVAAENYLQHAEHYNRIVMTAQAQFQQERQAQFGGAEDGGAYEEDRAMNGRGVNDRFEFTGDDDEGDDRFDSTEEEQERTLQLQPPPRPQPPMRQDDRPRGPRPERFGNRDRNDRGDGRNDYRNDRPQRFDRPDDQRGERPNDRGNDRPDRSNERSPNDRGPADRNSGERGPNDRGNGGQRFDRPDDRGERGERFDRPNDRGDRNERPERGERPERPERIARSDELDVQPDLIPVASVAPEAASPVADEAPRRRRGRPPRAQNGADIAAVEPDVTPDGAAALVAFPE